MATTGGYENVVLPNLFSSPGEALDNATKLHQQRNDFNAEMNLRYDQFAYDKKKQDDIDNWKKINYIEQETDPSQYLTGVQKADVLTQQMAENLKKKYIALASDPNVSINEIAVRLQNEWGNVIQGDLAIKNKIAQETANIKSASDKNKNLNTEQLRNDVLNAIGNDYIVQTPDGNLVYKPIDQIDYNKNYTGDILAAPDAYKYAISAAPLIDYLQKGNGDDVSIFTKGNSSITKWGGKVSPFQSLNLTPDANGYVNGNPALQYNTEKVNGIDLTPQNLFDTQIYDTPEKKFAFDMLYHNYINNLGLKPKTPEEDNILRRAFAQKELVKRYVQNQVYPKDVQNIPHAPNVHVSVGGAENSNINDVYKGIEDVVSDNNSKGFTSTRINSLNTDAQSIIIDFAKKVSGDDNLNNSNTFLHKEPNGEIAVYKTTDNQNVISKEALIGVLPRTGVNLKAQSDVKAKREVVNQGNHNNTTPTPKPPATKAYKYNGKNISLDAIKKAADASGLTVDEYIKKAGIQ